MNLFHGLFSMIGLFILEKLLDSAHAAESRVRKCQYIPQLYDVTKLKGNSCLQSQLADETRYKLVDFFTDFRSDTATGAGKENKQKYSNIFKINYHWICEYFAMYVMNNKMPYTSGPLEYKNETTIIIKKITDEILSDPGAEVNLGSFGSAADLTAYDYTFAKVPIDISTQNELIKIVQDSLQNSIHTLELLGVEIFWPGTTYFGCSLCIDNSSFIACVFATSREADRDLKKGEMNDETCKTAKPEGVFDAAKYVCIDLKHMSASHDYDMPCQFYYLVPNNKPAWMLSCDGVDAGKDMLFTALQEDTEVNYGGKKIMIKGPQTPDDDASSATKTNAALALHLNLIIIITFSALIDPIFSHFSNICKFFEL